MSLSQISKRISDSITEELDYSEDKKAVVAYGIESVFLTIIGYCAIIFIAYLFNVLAPTAMAAIFGGLLRKVSGGAHFNTPFKCLAFGAVIYTLLGFVAKEIIRYNLYNIYVNLVVLVFCLIIVAYLAPVDCKAKPINSQNLRRNLKIISIGFIVIALLVMLISHNQLINTGAVLGIGYQTMTLLPVFNKEKRRVYS